MAPKVGLFIPCYIDQLYPQVGIATLKTLEHFGCDVEYPESQTCCGQPMANTGCTNEVGPLARRFLEIFKSYDAVVCPSGSCVSMVKHHYDEYFTDNPEYEALKAKTFEFCEYLTNELGIDKLAGRFPHKVGLHQSCHGLRELRLASSSELRIEPFGPARALLESIDGVEVTTLKRPDECCGFGGTFAVAEEAVSCMMGEDRVSDHEQAGTEVLTALDMSCLMHMSGIIRRQQKPIRVMHISEIFAECL
ncbi:(Fe-S)-binding protein [Gimesia fumaroli]|jgi:L-lactate dehydrogenase complex protein LldE|uniref:Lactate utilization protein A n=1 Tax=Gimesia fumaroli TaxID=2527976 RepID=A0A518I4J8_9PLAN|nr:(Fe-S)-binding protein [Gimesia fumaroli]QDV48022.1 Lactate utilization protein A [Gimesia fumaroli]